MNDPLFNEIAQTFSGDLGVAGISALLATTDDEGWPHIAFLSAGEVLIAGGDLALTLWATSGSAAALRRDRRAVLYVASGGAVCELRLAVRGIRAPDATPSIVARCEVVAVREHRAPYAEVDTLIGFSVHDESATLTRWRAQIAAMRGAIADAAGQDDFAI